MTKDKERDLRKKILEEMTVDYSNALDRYFDLAKQFIKITKEGKVDILHKDKINGKEQVLLYLIGKLYAKEAGFISIENVGNKELMEELGIPIGSILPWIKDLKDNKKIKPIRRGRYIHHSISINLIEKTLKNVEKKLKKVK
jgi:hypothetical protein